MTILESTWLIPGLLGFILGILVTVLFLQRRLANRDKALALSEEGRRQALSEVESLRQQLMEAEKTRQHLLTQNIELNTRLEEQRRHHEDRVTELENARRHLKAEFEALAARILDEKARQFGEQSQHRLDQILAPVRQQLQDFRHRIDAIHSEEQKQHGSLLQELRRLQEANHRLNQEADKLARALRNDSKSQGTWGEVVLETVLERSGLRKGREFQVQGTFKDGEGKSLRPDVIVHLPDGRDVVIDAKVSLRAWQDFVDAADDGDRRDALRRHLESIRRHIDELSAKRYQDLPGLNCLDFVLLFMPIEAAFSAAFQADPDLFVRAFEKRIVVVTPTTLLATLRTIENLWRFERQQENVRKVFERAAKLYDKLCGFLEDFEKIGRQLDTVHDTYRSARGKLTDGRGNLIRQAQALVELGTKPGKSIPDGLRQEAGADDPP